MKPKRARIYMLGDSLTEGEGGSYRLALFERLCRAGASFEFLGENIDGDIRLPGAYRRYGGGSGKAIGGADEAGTLRHLLTEPAGRQAAARSDMILLWAGVDDPASAGRYERYERLIEDIFSINPDVTVYAATLPDRDEAARDFNRRLLSRSVESDAERGHRLRIVDMNRGERRLGRAAFPADAESRMDERQAADAWMGALGEDVLELNRRGDPDYTEGVRVAATSADLRDTALRPGEGLTFHAAVLPDNAENTAVLWHSSASDVASVDDYGTVRALSPGNALISATTLEGGFRALARLNVSGEPFDPGAGLETAFVLSHADDWQGDTAAISDGRLLWNRLSAADGALETKAALPAGGKTLLSFDYAAAQERTRSPERYISIGWGGIEMRLSAGGMTVTVLEKGEMRLTARLLPKQSLLEGYALLRDGRTLTLWKNGEKLGTARTQLSPEAGRLTIVWHDFAFFNEIRNFSCKIG